MFFISILAEIVLTVATCLSFNNNHMTQFYVYLFCAIVCGVLIIPCFLKFIEIKNFKDFVDAQLFIFENQKKIFAVDFDDEKICTLDSIDDDILSHNEASDFICFGLYKINLKDFYSKTEKILRKLEKHEE